MAKYKIIYDCFKYETKIGGFGVVILDEKDKMIASRNGGENKTGTENRLRLYGILIGLRMLPDGSEVTLISDDEYSIKTSLNMYKRQANLDILEKIDYEKKRMKNVTNEWLHDCSKKEQDYAKYCQTLSKDCVMKKEFGNPLDYMPKKCAAPDEDAKVKEELEHKLEINKHLDAMQATINQLQNEINELRKLN